MRNFIWINHTKERVLEQLESEGAYAVFVHWNDPIIKDIRKFIKQTMEVSYVSGVSRVMVLDAMELNPMRFTLFLKLLEQSGNLYLSFFGARLNQYPLTVISRCTVRMRSVHDNVAEKLTAFEKLNYLEEVKLLCHYDVETAVRMIDCKPHFVDMLVKLEDLSPEQYSGVRRFQGQPVEFIYLFYEWLNRNKLFATVDLDRCHFLREEDTIKLLQELSTCDPMFENYLIDLLFVRKAVLNAY